MLNISYEIGFYREFSEYTLFIINNGEYRVLGQYCDFKLAEKEANLHYQKLMSLKL